MSPWTGLLPGWVALPSLTIWVNPPPSWQIWLGQHLARPIPSLKHLFIWSKELRNWTNWLVHRTLESWFSAFWLGWLESSLIHPRRRKAVPGLTHSPLDKWEEFQSDMASNWTPLGAQHACMLVALTQHFVAKPTISLGSRVSWSICSRGWVH